MLVTAMSIHKKNRCDYKMNDIITSTKQTRRTQKRNSHITGRIKPEMRLAGEMIQRLLVYFGQAIDTLDWLTEGPHLARNTLSRSSEGAGMNLTD